MFDDDRFGVTEPPTEHELSYFADARSRPLSLDGIGLTEFGLTEFAYQHGEQDMTALAKTFGVAARNFTAYPEMPDARALVDYGVRSRQLGYDSVWVWDHILLGVQPNFPGRRFADGADRHRGTDQRIKLGTGVLVLPLRNPVMLAKQLAQHGPAFRVAA